MSAMDGISVPVLLARLDSPETALESVKELGRRRAREATPHLSAVLRTTGDPRVRNAAALALSDMHAPEGFDGIVEMLRDPRTQNNRGTLLYALEPYDNAPILELLVELAITGGYEVRMSAFGLINGINSVIDEPVWNRVRERLEAASTTADDERRTEVITPLLALFQ